MKKPNDIDRLNHILDAIAKFGRYLQHFGNYRRSNNLFGQRFKSKIPER
jgi:hypothetical protein